MRKQSFVVGCDFCKKISEVEKPSDTPDGWYHVNISNKNGKVSYDVNAFDLCSIVCVQDWATARLDVLTQWEHVNPPQDEWAKGTKETLKETVEDIEALWDEQDRKEKDKEASRLLDLLDDIEAEEAEKKPKPRYAKVQCEYCNEMLSTQGMRLHMKHKHPELFGDWMKAKGFSLDNVDGMDRTGKPWTEEQKNRNK